MTRRAPSALVVVLALVLFAAIAALRVSLADASTATLILLVGPIALCAIEFGVVGGLASAFLALLLTVGLESAPSGDVGPLGIATRATAFVLVGALLGRFVDGRRVLETDLERHHELSRDLFATAKFNGCFERLNPAWEKVLGYSREELLSRPILEFVHPDDRERTEAEIAKLVAGESDTTLFRNRRRTADGRYVWLEWNAHADRDEGRIYATARDITVQREAEQALRNESATLERTVQERTRELQDARLETLRRLAIAAEYRDDETHEHTERVGRTAALITRGLGLSDEVVALMRWAAPLHDVGKLGIPDAVLLKPGTLTADEFELMKTHVWIGAEILAYGSFAILKLASEIALSHHERWDGTGYPEGLAGEAIPLTGRIVAVADVFDSLVHDRPYKQAWPVARAVEVIKRLGGRHFDPAVVRAFEELDHQRLLEPIDRYDVDAPRPPLTVPDEIDAWGSIFVDAGPLSEARNLA